MCFSASASFAAAAVLLPAGGYCVFRALRSAARLRLLPLALTPIAFAAQQFSEGLVWLGLNGDDAVLVRNASVVFLFFAIFFWPFWIALSMTAVESRPGGRVFLAVFAVLSLAWAWLFFPVAEEPARWLTTQVVHHSIQYGLNDLPAFQVLPRPVWRGAYVLAICVPLVVCRPFGAGRTGLRVFGGALVAGLFVLSYFLFWYAFTSVWCFFAALASLLLCRVFAKVA